MAADATPRPDTEVLSVVGGAARAIGNYELGERLGAGASSEVYAARHRFLGDAVAIKLLHAKVAADAVANAEFLAEARTARTIEHPNVVRVVDFGDAPVRYLVMERLVGETLATRVRRMGRLDEASVRAIGAAIARGAAAAHAAGIVHRDLKPGNVVLVGEGGEGSLVRPVIVDFGIARFASDAAATPTRGTPPYMAPEQLVGDEVSPAADVFALGVVLYELTTGALPLGGNADERRANLQRVVDVVPGTSVELAKVIAGCLVRAPAARPTMEALADALDARETDTVTLVAIAPATSLAKRPVKTGVIVAVVGGSLAVVVLGVLLWLMRAGGGEAAAPPPLPPPQPVEVATPVPVPMPIVVPAASGSGSSAVRPQALRPKSKVQGLKSKRPKGETLD